MRVEVGVEQAVDDAQHVAVELGGGATRVVVSGLEGGDVLHQVDAEQEPVAGPQRRAQAFEKAWRLVVGAQAAGRCSAYRTFWGGS